MKNWKWCLVGFILLACVTISCYPSANTQKQQETRAGLDIALAQLPEVQGFTPVKTLVSEFYDNEHGGEVCYYGTAYVVFGSTRPMKESLDTYAQVLRSAGWSEGKEEYETSRLLFYGDKERVVISYGSPSLEIEKAVDYKALERSYTSVIIISVDYILPHRDGC